MIVSIHQPAFIPWLPFFEKIRQSDVFIFLTHCQFQKNNYQNRFFYSDKWNTMSVNRGLDPIVDKKYVSFERDWNKIKVNNPSKKKILERFDNFICDSLVDTNTRIIEDIARVLDIKTKILHDESTDLMSTDRLVWLCKQVGAKKYIAGASGKDYMDLDAFHSSGIEIIFQEYPADKKIHVLDLL